MKLYTVCCVVVLGIFIYGGQGKEECVIKETFNEIKQEMKHNQEDSVSKEALNHNVFNL